MHSDGSGYPKLTPINQFSAIFFHTFSMFSPGLMNDFLNGEFTKFTKSSNVTRILQKIEKKSA